ncbi:rhodanese-like domain-containing protein [Herbaspirillum sp. ST 5-3]|uniref:rhodanese-like domain-containing protein n=1 Tax=Oxalobacteraceae TaxID=75682 RepID=UPI001B3B7363|nr:rhodanese-like domain-containing protein [Herbaspirillum sp. ST 5-3]
MNTLRERALGMLIAFSLSGVLCAPAHAVGPQVHAIDVEQGRFMASQGALLLDVREPEEYAQGHAPDSILIPLGQLQSRLEDIRAFERKPIAVICRSGRRSAQAARMLSETGFTEVFDVQGGMNAWERAALPIVKVEK